MREGLFSLIKLVLEQMGVRINGFNTDPPKFYIELVKDKMILNTEETLRETYSILYKLLYGSSVDKSNTLEIKYKEVESREDY